jgi:hypothetical protein
LRTSRPVCGRARLIGGVETGDETRLVPNLDDVSFTEFPGLDDRLMIVAADNWCRLNDMVAISDLVDTIFRHSKIRRRPIACRDLQKIALPHRPAAPDFASLTRIHNREQLAINDVADDKSVGEEHACLVVIGRPGRDRCR